MDDPRWEEQALHTAVLRGDEAAWRTLYDRHFAGLFRYVYYRAGRDRDRTQEVVQECWIVAVRRMRHFDPTRAPFGAWMRGVADGVLRNKKRRWRRRDGAEVPLSEGVRAVPVGPVSGVAQADHVAVAMTALPEQYQMVLRAKYHEGRSVAEIALRDHKSGKAVESLLTRARAAFRREYERLNEE